MTKVRRNPNSSRNAEKIYDDMCYSTKPSMFEARAKRYFARRKPINNSSYYGQIQRRRKLASKGPRPVYKKAIS